MIQSASDQAFLLVVITGCLGACLVWLFGRSKKTKPMSIALTQTVKPGHRDTQRYIASNYIEFYRKRAHELRAEYYRDKWQAARALLTSIGRRRSSA